MKNLKFVLVLMIAMLVVFVAGTALADVTEITVWHCRSNYVPVDRYEEFHAANPNIRVNYDVVPVEEHLSMYLRSYVVGNAPDILMDDHGALPMLVEQGMARVITPIKEMWEAEDPADFQDLMPITWNAYSYKGDMYGVAYAPFIRQLNYRMDLFADAGLTPPVYWDDVLDNARKLRTDDMLGYSQEGSRVVIPHDMPLMYQQMGGQFPENVIQLDSDAGIAMLGFLQTLMRENLADPDALSWDQGNMRAAFIEGRTAQNFMSQHMYPLVQQNFEYKEDWAFVPVVKRQGAEDEATQGSIVYGYMVSSQSKAPLEDIMKVLQHLLSAETLSPINFGYAPGPRASVYLQPEFVEDLPWYKDLLLDAMLGTEAFPVHQKQPLIYEVMHDARQEVMANLDADVAELAARYQQGINALLD